MEYWYKGDRDLTEIKGSPTYVAGIWSGPTWVGIDCGNGEESCSGGKVLLDQDRLLLQIFGWIPCRFRIFGSGFMSVENIDAPNKSPGEGMPFGSTGICRDLVDSVYNVVYLARYGIPCP